MQDHSINPIGKAPLCTLVGWLAAKKKCSSWLAIEIFYQLADWKKTQLVEYPNSIMGGQQLPTSLTIRSHQLPDRIRKVAVQYSTFPPGGQLKNTAGPWKNKAPADGRMKKCMSSHPPTEICVPPFYLKTILYQRHSNWNQSLYSYAHIYTHISCSGWSNYSGCVDQRTCIPFPNTVF